MKSAKSWLPQFTYDHSDDVQERECLASIEEIQQDARASAIKECAAIAQLNSNQDTYNEILALNAKGENESA